MARIINSPGVQITEKDLSQRSTTSFGTNVVVMGFSSQGPASEPIQITTTNELERIYGVPNTAAERYFYYSCREVLNSPGVLTTIRLPYGEEAGTTHTNLAYSGLFYPVVSAMPGSQVEWEIGAPEYKTLTQPQYQTLQEGSFVWNDPNNSSFPLVSATNSAVSTRAGFFILNYSQTTINEFAEGYYVGFADNTAFDSTTSPDFQSINFLNTAVSEVDLDTIPETRLDFALSATSEQASKGLDSISEQLEKVGFTGFETAAYSDHLSLGVFKIRRSTSDSGYLTLANAEKFIGSFDVNRRVTSPSGGTLVNAYIEDSINANSSNIRMYINPSIAKNFKWTGNTSTPLGSLKTDLAARGLFPLGVYKPDTRSQELGKVIGDVTAKLDRALRTIESVETTTVDIVCDAGLSNIYASTQALATADYDDERAVAVNTNSKNAWLAVANTLVTFSQNNRKDCISIIDPLRSIFVNGRDAKVSESLTKTFTQDIYAPLKECTSALGDTNYAALYGNWIKLNDIYSSRRFWAPFSGYAAAVMARSDAAGQFWTPPAGLNRGGFLALDVAFNPNQKQRDRMYEISVNPVVFFTGDGFTVLGQKTLQSRPTAFDRINVRRLFLALERATQRTLKYFVFEPNTVFTRSRLVNTIQPIFENAKATDGLYDYLLVCDERNNTPETIDQNELIVDIYLKPVKAAEFILVNFVATRTGQDFSEVL